MQVKDLHKDDDDEKYSDDNDEDDEGYLDEFEKVKKKATQPQAAKAAEPDQYDD